MPLQRPKKKWADPSREGRSKGRQGERFCSKCGNTVQHARILKSLNLCEFCIKEYEAKKDGINSCRGCGKVAPVELQEHNGYCNECVCSACGKPDPQYVRKTGLCYQCASALGDFCRRCGKEAAAQVRKNKGYCDECAAKGGGRETRNRSITNSGRGRRPEPKKTFAARPVSARQPKSGSKRSTSNEEREVLLVKRNKPVVGTNRRRSK